MYGGMCTSEYTQSLLKLSESANKSEGVKLTTVFLGNESLIQRGRNTIAHHFMNLPDATHLLFIDADIKFRVEDIVKMILVGLVVYLILINSPVWIWLMKTNHLKLNMVAMHL